MPKAGHCIGVPERRVRMGRTRRPVSCGGHGHLPIRDNGTQHPSMNRFLEMQPTLENHWRALCLFGRNVATYKFALGRALLELRDQPGDRVSLEDLALPFATGVCQHLQTAPKQATSASSRFLDGCRAFNSGKIDEATLRTLTVRFGFNNVIDAFHRLGPADLDRRFFADERPISKSIRLTDELRALGGGGEAASLALENEARWNLVETAWEIGLSRSLIEFQPESQDLIVRRLGGRVAVTSARSALNGYQKGHCFYCFAGIDIADPAGAVDVDHFFPWALRYQLPYSLNGVWNLVLACAECNRGQLGKFDLIPESYLLERLHNRNEFLIASHNPLRETLMAQTGVAESDRVGFLQAALNTAIEYRIARWTPAVGRCREPVF